MGEIEDQKIKGDDPRYFLMKLTNYVDTVDQLNGTRGIKEEKAFGDSGGQLGLGGGA